MKLQLAVIVIALVVAFVRHTAAADGHADASAKSPVNHSANGFRKLFSKNKDTTKEMKKAKESFEETIKKAKEQNNSLTNPEFVKSMLEKQDKYLGLVMRNYLSGLPKDGNEFAKKLEKKLKEENEKAIIGESGKTHPATSPKQENPKKTEDMVNGAAELLTMAEQFGEAGKNEEGRDFFLTHSSGCRIEYSRLLSLSYILPFKYASRLRVFVRILPTF